MPTVLQSRADHTDAELEKEGLDFDLDLLTTGADTRLALWKEDQATLAQSGYDDPWATDVQAVLADLRGKHVQKDVAKADKTTSKQTSAARTDLVDWVRMVKSNLKQAPRAVREAALKLPAGWAQAARLPHAAETLIAFCTQQDFRVRAVRSAAAATDGQAKLAAYNAAHATHAAASTSAEVKAAWVAAGLLAFELIRLAEAAKDLLPPERAAKYETTSLRHGNRKHAPKTP